MPYQRIEIAAKHLRGTEVPYQIRDVSQGIVDDVLARTGTRIDVVRYYPSKHFREVRGAIERLNVTYDIGAHKSIANIYYKEGDNYCWERLSKCKELCQLLLDTPQTRVSSFTQLRNFFKSLTAAYTQAPDKHSAEAKRIDELGLLVALEVLFPMEHRLVFLPKLDDSETKSKLLQKARLVKPIEKMVGKMPRHDIPESPSVIELLSFVYRVPKVYVEHLMDPTTAVDLLQYAQDSNPARYGKLKIL